MSTSTTSRAQVTLNYALIVLCTLIAVYPLVGVFLASLYPTGPGSQPSVHPYDGMVFVRLHPEASAGTGIRTAGFG